MKSDRCDFLVIGSGISGLYFALKAAEYGKVIIITKDNSLSGSTRFAQGGVAVSIGEGDSPEKHMKDTLNAGAGLCDEKSVEILVNDGIERIHDLLNMGILFTKDELGNLDLGMEGGHSDKRIIHFLDQTGKNIQNFLLEKIAKNNNIKLMENQMAVDLITEHHMNRNNREKIENCYGIYALDTKTNEICTILANFTLIATGGAGRVYPFSTNPSECTGDGVAMAYRAGCNIRNLEFIQFHPTVLYFDSDPAFLLSEAIRGEGAKLINKQGEYFMKNYHPMEELAPRDIVARSIDSELKKHGDKFVYLDCRSIGQQKMADRFPYIYETLKSKYHLDAAQDLIPVVPAAHYLCGGVLTDYNGLTNIKYLYAAGETASTGVHGANRLASNSLLESLVFSYRAVQDIVHRYDAKRNDRDAFGKIPPWNNKETVHVQEWGIINHLRREIQDIMWDYIGIVRSKPRLDRALKIMDIIQEDVNDYYQRARLTREILELRNIILCARLIIRSCLERDESRGLHFLLEAPEHREDSRMDTIILPESIE
ncbi:MAG: L-aspartate oxidase [Spirochaetia bacterium]|nr:L-aspartate oxidase [Spirochaetia bacterium]